jgi:hypothetical protein
MKMIEKFVVIPEGCDCHDTDAFDSPDGEIFDTLEDAKADAANKVLQDREELEEDDRSAYNIYKITAVRLASVI